MEIRDYSQLSSRHEIWRVLNDAKVSIQELKDGIATECTTEEKLKIAEAWNALLDAKRMMEAVDAARSM